MPPLTLTNPNPSAPRTLHAPSADGWHTIDPQQRPTADSLTVCEPFRHVSTSADGQTWHLQGPERTLLGDLRGHVNVYVRADHHVQATFTLQQARPLTIILGEQDALQALLTANLMPPAKQHPDLWTRTWTAFDTPLDDDQLAEPFLHFTPGTPHDDVLHFFDRHSPQGLFALMYTPEPAADTGELRRVLSITRDTLSTTRDALDDASSAVDASDSETYAYQTPLEQAADTLTLIERTLGKGA